MALSRYQIWYGRDSAPAVRHVLRAGPLTAVLDGADVRRVRVGGVEVAQRIYVAVRDEVWNTIPATYSGWQLAIAPDHFSVGFTARHRHDNIDFSWRGQITGTVDGVISYAMDGVAEAAFRYCKIGFNVHHPLHGSVERPYRAETSDGRIEGTLPALIDPQRVRDGQLTAMFAPYRSLAIDVQDGLTARFDFEGDLFELQDHRNWTDGNFKSYGTPLSIPIPFDAQPGQRLQQRVTLSVAGSLPELAAGQEPLRVELGRSTGYALPPIGTCTASQGNPLSEREADLLRALRLDHLRVDIQLDAWDWPERLRQAASDCSALGSRLELALFVAEDADAAIDQCAAMLQSLAAIPARVLVFPAARGRSTVAGSTPASLVRRVREHLEHAAPGVPIAGGTKLFFAEINRDPPEFEAMDAVVFSVNPQVHACDDTSLVENLEAQAEVVRSARALCGDRPILVSPISFIGRDGPYAAGPPEPHDLPGNVDMRQSSLFGAGWTAGSVRYLASSGAASLTYYETTGWLGLIETDAGSPMPDRFPSYPGMAFPLYHVFADLAEWKGAEVIELRTTDALAVDGIALRGPDGMHVLIANLSGEPRTVSLGPLDGDVVRVRRLDEESAFLAGSDPSRFRATGDDVPIVNREVQLALAPFALARVDAIGQ